MMATGLTWLISGTGRDPTKAATLLLRRQRCPVRQTSWDIGSSLSRVMTPRRPRVWLDTPPALVPETTGTPLCTICTRCLTTHSQWSPANPIERLLCPVYFHRMSFLSLDRCTSSFYFFSLLCLGFDRSWRTGTGYVSGSAVQATDARNAAQIFITHQSYCVCRPSVRIALSQCIRGLIRLGPATELMSRVFPTGPRQEESWILFSTGVDFMTDVCLSTGIVVVDTTKYIEGLGVFSLFHTWIAY